MISNSKFIEEGATPEEFIFEFKQQTIIYGEKECTLTIAREVTDLIKAEYTRTASHLSEMLFASISHDMRTPLNSIIQMHDILDSTPYDDKTKKYLKV